MKDLFFDVKVEAFYMKIVYANEKFPEKVVKSIFLAGPTPRDAGILSWRPEALKMLKELGYDGHVFFPEPRDGIWRRDYYGQIEWEERGLNKADCVLFWIPRNLETLPAFTTNVEFGMWARSGKIVLGSPHDAQKMKYLNALADEFGVVRSDTLRDTLRNAMSFLGDGALRKGGECDVPLHIWKIREFQNWYAAQKNAGNRLDSAKEIYAARPNPKKKFIFLWILHVNVYIVDEGRNKVNEFILGRPDISTVLLYKKARNLMDTQVILVREFRSPAATDDGMIHELAGGSSKHGSNPMQIACDEVSEETGLVIEPHRIRRHGARQLAGTLSVHRSELFSVEITQEELEFLRQQEGIAHGVMNDSERTYVEIFSLRQIMEKNLTDWSTIGMIAAALAKINSNEKSG